MPFFSFFRKRRWVLCLCFLLLEAIIKRVSVRHPAKAKTPNGWSPVATFLCSKSTSHEASAWEQAMNSSKASSNHSQPCPNLTSHPMAHIVSRTFEGPLLYIWVSHGEKSADRGSFKGHLRKADSPLLLKVWTSDWVLSCLGWALSSKPSIRLVALGHWRLLLISLPEVAVFLH